MAGRPLRRARLAAKLSNGDFASARFLRSAHRANPPLLLLARQEVPHLLQMRGSVPDWIGRYEQVKDLGAGTVLELDLGGACRMLVHAGEGGSLTLLDMGDHDLVPRYRKAFLAKDLLDRVPLPDEFRPGAHLPSFAAGAAGRLAAYGNETRPEWLYFLGDEQLVITDQVVEEVENALLGDVSAVHFLLGGPGTGKTSVLLQLLMRLSDAVVDGRETWDVRLEVSDRLAEFIAASTGWDLAQARRPVTPTDPADVVLIDDPSSSSQIRRYVDQVKSGSLGAVVVGFDPLQLMESLDDHSYQSLVRTCGAREYPMTSCYRQKAEVGAQAKHVADAVAASSPFLREDKKAEYAADRQRLTAIANDLAYPNPSGYARTFENATVSEWRHYLSWMKHQQLWTHWSPFLVVVDEAALFPASWAEPAEGIRHDVVKMRDIASIKGLEYQHVALLMTAKQYADVASGFSSSGRTLYDQYRLIRIPFSRAKDSMVTFVLA